MLSEIVRSGVRQKLRATKGGTIATQATMIQFEREWIPTVNATRHTTIAQATKS